MKRMKRVFVRIEGNITGCVRILWHEVRCPWARAGGSSITNTKGVGRVYDCVCNYGFGEFY